MKYLDIGRVIGLHGVRGKIKVAAFSEDPSGVLAAKALRLSGGRGMTPGAVGNYEVATAQRTGGCAVFSLRGIDSIEAAEPLVKAVVSMRYEALPPLPEDEFYWVDAVGCLVVDEAGAPLGEVVADSKMPRDGRCIAYVGTYAPRENPAKIVIDEAVTLKWLAKGALPTETVKSLLKKSGAWKKFLETKAGKPATV